MRNIRVSANADNRHLGQRSLQRSRARQPARRYYCRRVEFAKVSELIQDPDLRLRTEQFAGQRFRRRVGLYRQSPSGARKNVAKTESVYVVDDAVDDAIARVIANPLNVAGDWSVSAVQRLNLQTGDCQHVGFRCPGYRICHGEIRSGDGNGSSNNITVPRKRDASNT